LRPPGTRDRPRDTSMYIESQAIHWFERADARSLQTLLVKVTRLQQLEPDAHIGAFNAAFAT
jgi:hypothetical protein